MSLPDICPICDEGLLSPQTYSDRFIYEDQSIFVEGLHSSVCNHCGANPLLSSDIKFNHQLVSDAKRKAAGLLTGNDIKRIRGLVRISQSEASKLFGGGSNAFSKYERGEVIQSLSMDRLLRLVEMAPGTINLLKLIAGAGQDLPKLNYSDVSRVEKFSRRGRRPPCSRFTSVAREGWQADTAL